MANKRKGRRVTSASAPSSQQQHPRAAAAIVADPDDTWSPCKGHPPSASVGFVGGSPTWPPPADDEPRCDSARLAAESAEYGSLEIAAAFAKLERRLAEGSGPR